MLKLLILSLVFASCLKHEDKKPFQKNEQVKEKSELYISLHPGWAHSKCDSLGFTSLCKLAGGCKEADIYKAEGEPGRWYRSPEHDCFDLGQSKSDISKDMLMMLFPYLYSVGDKQNLKEIYDYGQNNGWIMGRGLLSRTLMTPAMVWTLQRMLGMAPLVDYETKEVTKAGYEKHLDAINLILKSMIGGGMDELQFEVIKKYREESPQNALFQAIYHKYADGDQFDTIAILLDESLFPSDRLPTAKDRCEEYLWQRNYGDDWKPCDSQNVHDGVDYIMAAWVAGQL